MNENKITHSSPCPICGADQCCGHARTVHFGTESFEIEPCARCGGAADLRLDSDLDTDYEHSTYSVFCTKCYASGEAMSPSAAAVECWNEKQEEKRHMDSLRAEAAAFIFPLKPCPFCGSQPELLPCPKPDEEGFLIRCLCYSSTCAETFLMPTPTAAAIAWNTRVKTLGLASYLGSLSSQLFVSGSVLLSLSMFLAGGAALSILLLGFFSFVAAVFVFSDEHSSSQPFESVSFDKSLPRCPSCGDYPAVKRTPSGCFHVSCSNDHCWGQRNCDQRFLKKEDAAAYWRGYVASRSEKEA